MIRLVYFRQWCNLSYTLMKFMTEVLKLESRGKWYSECRWVDDSFVHSKTCAVRVLPRGRSSESYVYRARYYHPNHLCKRSKIGTGRVLLLDVLRAEFSLNARENCNWMNESSATHHFPQIIMSVWTANLFVEKSVLFTLLDHAPNIFIYSLVI